MNFQWQAWLHNLGNRQESFFAKLLYLSLDRSFTYVIDQKP